MVTLRCPYCNAQGLKHLGLQNLGAFSVIHCKQCGAIYGVVPTLARKEPVPDDGQKEPSPTKSSLPKPRLTEADEAQNVPARQPAKKEAPPSPKLFRATPRPPTPLQHAALSDADLLRIISDFVGETVSLSPEQIQHVYRNAKPEDRLTAPKCPQHDLPLLKLTIPPGEKYSGQIFWACPQYAQCRYWQTASRPPHLTASDMSHAIADFTGQQTSLTVEQMQLIYREASLPDGTIPPLCPDHHEYMVKIAVPPGFKHAGQKFWICTHYALCRQWVLPDGETLVQKPLTFLVELGSADLSGKTPYSPQKMAAIMRATGLGRGTMYRHIAVDEGPPFCLKHKVEMDQFTIPAGHKNAGIKVWICPRYDCREWELVDE